MHFNKSNVFILVAIHLPTLNAMAMDLPALPSDGLADELKHVTFSEQEKAVPAIEMRGMITAKFDPFIVLEEKAGKPVISFFHLLERLPVERDGPAPYRKLATFYEKIHTINYGVSRCGKNSLFLHHKKRHKNSKKIYVFDLAGKEILYTFIEKDT